MLRIVVPFLGISKFSLGQDITNMEDIRVLSELPMERLLSIKRGFVVEKIDYEGNSTDDEIESRTFPHALALQSKSKLKERGGHSNYYYEEHYEKDGKKNKIQSIFQISVTSLAFLAFGGYLICLLIHAIMGKQNLTATNSTQTLQTLSTFIANKIRQVKNNRRPNTRRKRRKNLKIQKKPNSNLQNRPNWNAQQSNKYYLTQKKPNGNNNAFIYSDIPRPIKPRPKRQAEQNAGFVISDEMYYSLLDLSESYTKYNTFDYLHFNNSDY